ncbi:TatD family hydrolase [Oribacterium sp. P9]|uniref:TatD family hydrolase n=1 Tax=Oribacterium sp. P9 TaxID=3378068 RepID=UPI003039B486|nr:TatD family hydrolase [Oribacterium sp.]
MKKASEIFDTHAHLCDAAFDDEREAIIADLGAHGVGAFTEIGFDLPSSRAALALAERYPQVYAAVGFHPDHSDHLRDEDVETLRQMVENNQKIVAIGEIGLDYHYTREGILRRAAASGQEPDPESLATADPEPEIQKACFRRMLQLARALGLPINVHSREAAQDTYDLIVEEHGYENSGIIHCFGYPVEMAERFVKLGLYVGVGGVVTFKNARKLKEVVARIPIERIVLETDCPYMAPVPKRGTRNDPRNLPYVVEEIAALRQMDPAEVIRITTENAKRVYRISE